MSGTLLTALKALLARRLPGQFHTTTSCASLLQILAGTGGRPLPLQGWAASTLRPAWTHTSQVRLPIWDRAIFDLQCQGSIVSGINAQITALWCPRRSPLERVLGNVFDNIDGQQEAFTSADLGVTKYFDAVQALQCARTTHHMREK